MALSPEIGQGDRIRTCTFSDPDRVAYQISVYTLRFGIFDVLHHFWSETHSSAFMKLVGMAGVEPTTSCSQSKRSTRLSYIPNKLERMKGFEPSRKRWKRFMLTVEHHIRIKFCLVFTNGTSPLPVYGEARVPQPNKIFDLMAISDKSHISKPLV